MTKIVIRKLLDLDFTQPSVTDEELLAALTIRIEEMLVNDKDLLLSLLYRLDVEEKPILEALHPGAADSPALGLARLVLARQKQRTASKRDVEVKPSGIPEGWEW